MRTAGQKTAGRKGAQPQAPEFRWSWKLITVAGIDVHIQGTFLLLIAFLALNDLVAGYGVTGRLRGTLLILAIFTTVVLHEYGHALTARRFGVRTLDITLLPMDDARLLGILTHGDVLRGLTEQGKAFPGAGASR